MISYCYDTYMLANRPAAPLPWRGRRYDGILSPPIMRSAISCSRTLPVHHRCVVVWCSAARSHPFPQTTDFSSHPLQAQSSGAKVLGFYNAGGDTVASVKQAKEFGITMKLATLLMFVNDVHALGLDVAQGLDADRKLLLGPGTTAPARLPNGCSRRP